MCGSKQNFTLGELFCLPELGPKLVKHDSEYGFNGVQLRDLGKLVKALGVDVNDVSEQNVNDTQNAESTPKNTDSSIPKNTDSNITKNTYDFFWASLSKNEHPLYRKQGRLGGFPNGIGPIFKICEKMSDFQKGQILAVLHPKITKKI